MAPVRDNFQVALGGGRERVLIVSGDSTKIFVTTQSLSASIGPTDTPYYKLFTVAIGAVAGFPHLYAYGDTKCEFLADLLGPQFTICNMRNVPTLVFQSSKLLQLSCNKFPNVNCKTKTAHSLYDCLMYHFQTKSYVSCPRDKTRHTDKFVCYLKTDELITTRTLCFRKCLRRRVVSPETPSSSSAPKRVKVTQLNTCNLYGQTISPAFVRKRVMLRHLFFINEDRTKYVYVGFYPNR